MIPMCIRLMDKYARLMQKLEVINVEFFKVGAICWSEDMLHKINLLLSFSFVECQCLVLLSLQFFVSYCRFFSGDLSALWCFFLFYI